MGFFQDAGVFVLVSSVVLLGLFSFQFGLFSNYGADMPTSSNPNRIGQNLSYINQTGTVNDIAVKIQEKIQPTNSTGINIPVISDAVRYFFLIADFVSLVFAIPTILFSFFGDMAIELGMGTPLVGIGVYVAYLLVIVLFIVGLAALEALIGRKIG